MADDIWTALGIGSADDVYSAQVAPYSTPVSPTMTYAPSRDFLSKPNTGQPLNNSWFTVLNRSLWSPTSRSYDPVVVQPHIQTAEPIQPKTVSVLDGAPAMMPVVRPPGQGSAAPQDMLANALRMLLRGGAGASGSPFASALGRVFEPDPALPPFPGYDRMTR